MCAPADFLHGMEMVGAVSGRGLPPVRVADFNSNAANIRLDVQEHPRRIGYHQRVFLLPPLHIRGAVPARYKSHWNSPTAERLNDPWPATRKC